MHWIGGWVGPVAGLIVVEKISLAFTWNQTLTV
jgi:hypothetical protein